MYKLGRTVTYIENRLMIPVKTYDTVNVLSVSVVCALP